MYKILLSLVLYGNLLIAASYNFTELRYNDAIGKSNELHGKITFDDEGLNINYNQDKKILDYSKGNLTYIENNKTIAISSQQERGIIQYFEILLLLHKGDESSLRDEFKIEETKESALLTPTGSIKHYINTIELIKKKQQLKQITLYLKNNDSITISIDDEIH